MTFTIGLSEEEFNTTLQEIDDLMASRGEKNLEGISMNDPLSQRVMEWFSIRYGDRLNLDTDFGQSVLILHGDIIRFRCPLFYGRLLVMCCPELMHHDFSKVHVNRPAVSNVLSLMNGITAAYSRSLTMQEREGVVARVVKCIIHGARISDAGTQAYVSEGRADLRTSVDQLMLNESQFGPSKWSSLQAVEKLGRMRASCTRRRFVTLRTLGNEKQRPTQNSPLPINSSSENPISAPHFRQALSRAGPL
jgi:hypothetical protein